MGQSIKPMIVIDTTRDSVRQLLRTLPDKKQELKDTLERLSHELAEIPSAAVLRGRPFDAVQTKGTVDPYAKMDAAMAQIQRDRSECWKEIDRAVESLTELIRLETFISQMPGPEGKVLVGLYLDRRTWDSMQEEMECARPTIAHYRNRGIDRIIARLYSRIRTIQKVL